MGIRYLILRDSASESLHRMYRRLPDFSRLIALMALTLLNLALSVPEIVLTASTDISLIFF